MSAGVYEAVVGLIDALEVLRDAKRAAGPRWNREYDAAAAVAGVDTETGRSLHGAAVEAAYAFKLALRGVEMVPRGERADGPWLDHRPDRPKPAAGGGGSPQRSLEKRRSAIGQQPATR